MSKHQNSMRQEKVVFNEIQATHFGVKTISDLYSGDVSFFFWGMVFRWFSRQMTGPTGVLLTGLHPEVFIFLLSKKKCKLDRKCTE